MLVNNPVRRVPAAAPIVAGTSTRRLMCANNSPMEAVRPTTTTSKRRWLVNNNVYNLAERRVGVHTFFNVFNS